MPRKTKAPPPIVEGPTFHPTEWGGVYIDESMPDTSDGRITRALVHEQEVGINDFLTFRDWHSSEPIFVQIRRFEESTAHGYAAWGIQRDIPSERCQERECRARHRHYIAMRTLPLSRAIDPHRARARSGGVNGTRTRGVPGRCHHCGQPTKGGRFIPGHDAKLKGELIREGGNEAAAERAIRGWVGRGGKYPSEVQALINEGDAFLQRRIQERWERADAKEEE